MGLYLTHGKLDDRSRSFECHGLSEYRMTVGWRRRIPPCQGHSPIAPPTRQNEAVVGRSNFGSGQAVDDPERTDVTNRSLNWYPHGSDQDKPEGRSPYPICHERAWKEVGKCVPRY